jgi:bifunctional DNase/RNase
MKTKHVTVHVKGVAMDQTASTSVVILSDESGSRLLPIELDPFGANCVLIGLDRYRAGERLTQDAIAETLIRHGFHLDSVEILGRGDGTFDSCLHYSKGFSHFEQSLSVAEGIVLAKRADIDLFVSDDALWEGASRDFPCIEESDSSSEIFYLDREWRPRSFV